MGVCEMAPVAGSHESNVQGLPSSISRGVPALQTPFASQVSAPLHKFPSVQLVSGGRFVCVTPVGSTHESVVHGLLSLELSGVPGLHTPPDPHVSLPLHTRPSEQLVPAGAPMSAGQVVDEPVHVSAGSHTPVDCLHVVPALPAGC